MIILALIVLLFLALFVAAIVASAIAGDRHQLDPKASTRTLERASEPVKERQRIGAPVKRSADVRPKPEVVDEPRAYFRAVGRVASPATDDVAVSYDGFFASANKPFKGGGRNDRKDATCFLTGQSREICECAECASRRRIR